jgi:RNase P subunit RPR2
MSGKDKYLILNLFKDFKKIKHFKIAPDGKSITCNKCNMTSYNPNDIKYKYCGNCHEFLEDK